MKFYKGFLAMLLVTAFAMAGYASDHYPKTEKVKHQTELVVKVYGKTLTKATDNFGSVNFEAIMPSVMFMPKSDGYSIAWSIGKPTGQLHESLITENDKNARTGNHRCKASRS